MAPTKTAAATQSARCSCIASAAPVPAHVVGDAFAGIYYDILRRSPEEAYMFYHDDSCVARPSAAGAGTDCITTRRGIAKTMEMDAAMARAEVLTVDTHHSVGGGFAVLVTGTYSAGDVPPRAFVQSFFLAPQVDGGYYVRNDTLRYVGAVAPPPLALQGANSPSMAVAVPAGADEEKEGLA